MVRVLGVQESLNKHKLLSDLENFDVEHAATCTGLGVQGLGLIIGLSGKAKPATQALRSPFFHKVHDLEMKHPSQIPFYLE